MLNLSEFKAQEGGITVIKLGVDNGVATVETVLKASLGQMQTSQPDACSRCARGWRCDFKMRLLDQR